MKRKGNVYAEEIVQIENCVDAAHNAVLHKKKLSHIHSFTFTVASNPFYYGYIVYKSLQARIKENDFDPFMPTDPDHFFIREGIAKKEREIFAPKLYPDQIAHWAIIQPIKDYFMKRFYYYSCGSIPNKGPRLVKDYLTKELSYDEKRMFPLKSTYKYCLKLDIHHFFQSVDREILMNILNRWFKDKDLLSALYDIINAPNTGTGIPIGFYPSQWLSNLYLDDFDRWLKNRLNEEFKYSIYIRYADDLVIVASNKRKLIKLKEEIKDYLWKNLKLTLKYDTNDQIFDIGKRPIDFVGFKFTYNKTTVRNRIFKNVIKSDKRLNSTRYTIKNLSSVVSYNGWTGTTDCYKVSKDIYKYNQSFYKSKFKQLAKTDKNYVDKFKRVAKARALKNAIIKMEAKAFYEEGLANLYVVEYDEETKQDRVVLKDSIKIEL